MLQRSSPYLSKGFGKLAVKRLTERPGSHPLPECVYNHRFIDVTHLHHSCSKAAYVFLQSFTLELFHVEKAGALLAKYCSLNSRESWVKDVMWPSGRLMNQSIAIPVKVLMKSLHLMASEPPTSNICVWNAVRCASRSSTPVKVALGPVNVLGIAVSRIACENGVVNSLGGDAASGSSQPRHLRRNSSLAWWSSSFLA